MPDISRSATIWCNSCRPIDSRSAVCALSVMACVKSCTSRIAFSGFHTIQKTMASTFTGTVSRVSVDSAQAGPRSPRKRPKRSAASEKAPAGKPAPKARPYLLITDR